MWNFPLSNYGQKRGLNDPGIQTFHGQLIESLAREICQNSLDAKLSSEKNVKIEFRMFELSTEKYPGISDFKKMLEECLDQAHEISDNKTRLFFENAIELTFNDRLKWIRISDFNTTGLTGSQKKGSTNWNNLVKSSGISDKGAESGGSFGIGKNAPFACSDFHTVFYSTLDVQNIQGFQGVSNLISVNKKDSSDHTQGIGYFSSDEKNNPINKLYSLDQTFHRVTSGTDIYIPAARFEMEEFEIGLIKGILNNFLYAIYEDTLEVIINNTTINVNTLHEIVNLYKNEIDIDTFDMYNLLIDKDTRTFIFLDNQAKLGLKINENGTKKITAIRKPWMKIKKIDGFKKSFNFSGYLLITGNSLNQFLRKMENPQHNDWETDRLGPDEKKHGKDIINKIKKFINEKITELMKTDQQDSLELIGASDYIQLISEKKGVQKISEKINNINVNKIKSKKTIQVFQDYGDEEVIIDEGDTELEFDKGLSRGNKNKSNPKNKNNQGNSGGKELQVSRKDLKIGRINNNGEYLLRYKKSSNNPLKISIHVLDEEGKPVKDYLQINGAYCNNEELITEGNVIKINKSEGDYINIVFKTNVQESLALGVKIYENS